MEFIDGYCPECNVLFVSISLSQNEDPEPIFLPKPDLLKECIDLRGLNCTKCCEDTDNDENVDTITFLKNILYYDGHSRVTLKTVIFCSNCNLVYHLRGDLFYSILSTYDPILINQQKLKRATNLDIALSED